MRESVYARGRLRILFIFESDNLYGQHPGTQITQIGASSIGRRRCKAPCAALHVNRLRREQL